MRIGISGAAGTGKTTLATALSEHLQWELIEDPTEEALLEKGFASWRGVRDPRTRREVRLRTFNIKMRRETDHPNCVSDKTVVDFLAYWLLNQAPLESGAQNATALEMIEAHLPSYDRILVLPWRREIGDGDGRNTDEVHALKIQACVEGLYGVLGVPFDRVEYTFGEDIAAFVARVIPELAKG